jgi:hypothetical protein
MKTIVKDIALTAAGLVVGGFVGYVVAGKRIEKRVQAHLDELDAVYEDSLARIQKVGQYETAEKAAAVLVPEEALGLNTEEAGEDESDFAAWNQKVIEDEETALDEQRVPKHLVEDYTETPENLADDEDPAAAKNLAEFVDRYRDRPIENFSGVNFPGKKDDDEDEEDEPVSSVPGFVTVRDPHGPYVISIDEYMDDNHPFTKIELTYFDGDDTLIDSMSNIVSEIDETVGRKNLSKWGEGTTAPDQVYIRNERLEADIELTKDDQTYTRVILGIIPEEEIARSMIKPLKMRDGDDE